MTIVQRLKEKSDIDQYRASCSHVKRISTIVCQGYLFQKNIQVHISLPKNVHSVFAMTLAMVSMISPADALLVWSQVIGNRIFTCNTDANKRPYNDCLNSMANICNTDDPTWDSTKKANCQTGVNTMFGMMNTYWQAVRRDCGRWS
jgi:hypothetical protein